MQIVIDISESDYHRINNLHLVPEELKIKIGYVIMHSVVLPKGHGRKLVLSENGIKEHLTEFDFSTQKWVSESSLSNTTLCILNPEEGG